MNPFKSSVGTGMPCRHWRQVIGLNRPGDAVTWKLKGVSLAGIGHFREARDAFNTSIEMDPDDAAAWKYKGAALVNLGRNRDAREAFDRSLELNPHDGETWKFKGVALENLDRLDEAVEAYTKAMELNPEMRMHGNIRAWCFWERSNTKMRLPPSTGFPKVMIDGNTGGLPLQSCNAARNPLPSWRKPTGRGPNRPRSGIGKGRYYQRTNRPKEAILAYHHAIQIKPDYSEAWENIAAIMTSLGRNQDAVNALDKARKITESRK